MSRALLRSAVPAAAILLLTVLAAFSSHGLGDYVSTVGDDNPRPVIEALQGGHLGAARHLFPAMGLVSVILRVPLSALAGGDHWLAYRFGAIGCLLPLAALAIMLDRRAAAAGAQPPARRVLAAVLIVGPGTLLSIKWGHPEQMLMAVLCVAAVLSAQAGCSVRAGVLLGLAVGTKQDAIVAALPVLLAAGGPGLFIRERVNVAAVAAGVALLCIAPVYLADPEHYRAMAHSLAHSRRVFAESIWWPIREHLVRTISLGSGPPLVVPVPKPPFGILRGVATSLAIPISLALLLVPAVRRRRVEPLALLAIVLAVRTVVDPMNIGYYVAPAMVALIAWETTRAPAEMPLISLAMSIATAFIWYLAVKLSTTPQFVLWVLATVPFFLLPFVPEGGLGWASALTRQRGARSQATHHPAV